MALQYKLEYLKDETQPEDMSVFIQLRRNTPIYQERINKEDYDVLSDGLKHEFLTGLFNIGGVVEVSTKAYRVWISKSPTFTWDEVLNPLLFYMKEYFEEDSLEKMQGSGVTLTSVNDRRAR